LAMAPRPPSQNAEVSIKARAVQRGVLPAFSGCSRLLLLVYYDYMSILTHDLQPRQIGSPTEARVVAELEARQQRLVTAAEVGQLAGVQGQRVIDVLAELRAHGWLRPLSLRGTYEFLPAAGGPLASGDVWLELRAALARDPAARAHVGLGSAAFLRGLADRRPLPNTIVWQADREAPPGLLRVYRVIRCVPSRFFGTEPQDGLPVAGVERIAVEVALWPQYAGDLLNPDHWIAAVLGACDAHRLAALALRAGPAATGRLGHLASARGVRAAILDALRPLPRAHPAWLGPRRSGARYDHSWDVYDTLGIA
jgi:predicted transcriptional regulator of viral defense system